MDGGGTDIQHAAGRRRRVAIAIGTVGAVVVVAFASVGLVGVGATKRSAAAAATGNAPAAFRAVVADAVPAPSTAHPQPVPDGYNHLIVTVDDHAAAANVVGPDGRRGRWVQLNAPGTPSRFTTAQQQKVLPYARGFVTDANGSTWVLLASNAPAGVEQAGGMPPAGVDALRALPGTTVRQIDAHTWAVRTKATAKTVAAAPGVATVGHDQIVTLADASTVSNDPMSNLQWALQNRGDIYVNQPGEFTAGADADVPPAWAYTRGEGAVVAVLDTPVDFSNPDLAGALWTNPNEPCGSTRDIDGDGIVGDCHGYDFGTNSITDQIHPTSSEVHGSHVSGIIAATTGNEIGIAGIAPAAKIMPVSISDAQGNIWVSAAAAAINYAVDHHADVINASWGGGGAMPSLLQTAINRAEAAGVVFVAAAGNDGANLSTTPFWPATATNSNVITVGASTGADQMASFSNYSSTKVAVFAPGLYILSTLPVNVNGGYGVMSGTSMAAPQVTGEVALLRSYDRTLSAAAVKARIMETAKPLPAFAGKSVSGARIDIGAALAATARSKRVSSFTFEGFNALDATKIGATHLATTLDAATVAAHPRASLTLTLATRVSGQVYAVANYPLSITLPGGTVTAITTDATGTATLDGVDTAALANTGRFGIDWQLPAGMYALNAQLTDAGSNIGTSGRVVFSVAADAASVPPTVPPTTAPDVTTTTAPPPTPSTSPSSPTSPTAPNSSTTQPATPGTTAPSSPTTAPPSPTTPTTAPRGGPSPTTAPSTPGTTAPPSPVTTAPSSPTTTPREPVTTTTLPLPEPPDAPDYLAGSAGDGTVELSWTAPHSGADGYRVYLDDQLIAQTTELSMTIDGLPNDQAYGFSVSAYSAFGESARTPTLWLTPRTSGSSPTTPSTAPPTTGAPSPSTAPVAPGPSAPSTPTTTPTTTTPAPAPSPYTVSPGSGPTSGGTFVSITGPNLGQLQGVDIDGAFLDGVMVLGNNWALGMTRPHAQPGTYDLVLHLAGRTVAVPGAFTYTGTAPPPTTTPATAPPPTTTPATAPPATQPPLTQPPATQPPVTQPPVTQPPAPPITDAPTTTTTAVPALPQVPGLELAPLPPTSPLADLPAGVWDGIACRASTCAG